MVAQLPEERKCGIAYNEISLAQLPKGSYFDKAPKEDYPKSVIAGNHHTSDRRLPRASVWWLPSHRRPVVIFKPPIGGCPQTTHPSVRVVTERRFGTNRCLVRHST